MSNESFANDLEALFSAIIAEARSNPAFAKKLANAVARGSTLKDSARRRVDWEAEKPSVDISGIFQSQGERSARDVMTKMNQRSLYAWLRTSKLPAVGASKMNKTQLMEHIVRHLRELAGQRASRFDY